MSGYHVMTLIYRRFHLVMGSGSVYSLLYRMEREGLIIGTWQQRRRVYELTLKGAKVVEIAQGFYKDFMDLSVLNVSGGR
jgi:DNA-binding PadR family transcriptional regulator